MLLSEFIKLSLKEMEEYVNAHTNFNFSEDQIRESILWPSYEEEYEEYSWMEKVKKINRVTYRDLWSDGRNFDIVQDDCGWEIVPTIVESRYSSTKTGRRDDDRRAALLLKKISKYGEVLFVKISYDSWSNHRMTLSINGDANIYTSNDENYPMVLLGDEDFSKAYLGLPFRINPKVELYSHTNMEPYETLRKKTCEAYPFDGIKCNYVYYPVLPNIKSFKTSKFVIDQYGKDVETYAKFVSEHKDWFETDHSAYNTRVFGLNEHKQYAYYMSYKYMYNDITYDDFVNLEKLFKDKTEVVTAFLKKCKSSRTMPLTQDRYYCSSTFNFGWNHQSLNFNAFNGVLQHLDEFRKLVGNASSYADTLAAAMAEYDAAYNEQKDACTADLAALYKYVEDELTKIHTKYSTNIDLINKDIVKKYKDVKKDIAIKHIDLEQTKETCLEAMNDQLTALGYTLPKRKKRNTNDHTKEVNALVKQIFDNVSPDIAVINLAGIYKCEDAPYETHIYDDLQDINVEAYCQLCESIGEPAAADLFDKLSDYTDDYECDDYSLYPGCRRYTSIDRNFRIIDGEED